MKLRKCPDCSNMINPESDGCPICGCNPRVRLMKRLFALLIVLVVIGWFTRGYWKKYVPAKWTQNLGCCWVRQ